MKLKIKINRDYVISQKELKEKLGLKGDIENISLYSGLNINDQKKGISKDKNKWIIQTKSI